MLKHSERLRGVNAQLSKVVEVAAAGLHGKFDVQLIEGLRTVERQRELYAQGRTAPGEKVTSTMASLHISGRAVDVAPIEPDGSIGWKNPKAFDALAAAMFDAAKCVGVRLRWGADWDMDGNPRERGETDSPHFELA